mmetsp:Transcript_6260/g.12409  ORF Transcript_6260/g.12409 Transcript_6260/m.12409 type:complete len:202 (+) Transcript_6260:3954-4559(+)
MSNGYVTVTAVAPAKDPAKNLCKIESISLEANQRLYFSKLANWTAAYGAIRKMRAVLPLQNPISPSECQMNRMVSPMDRQRCQPNAPATCMRILVRSSGPTAVLAVAPATPPAASDLTASFRPRPPSSSSLISSRPINRSFPLVKRVKRHCFHLEANEGALPYRSDRQRFPVSSAQWLPKRPSLRYLCKAWLAEQSESILW